MLTSTYCCHPELARIHSAFLASLLVRDVPPAERALLDAFTRILSLPLTSFVCASAICHVFYVIPFSPCTLPCPLMFVPVIVLCFTIFTESIDRLKPCEMNMLNSSPRLPLVEPLTFLVSLFVVCCLPWSSTRVTPGLFDSYDKARAQLRGFSGGKFWSYNTSSEASKTLADWSTALQRFSFPMNRSELRICKDGSASDAGTQGATAGSGFHVLRSGSLSCI